MNPHPTGRPAIARPAIAIATWLVLLAVAAPIAGQDLGVRVAAGPAVAGARGFAGMLSLQLAHGRLLLRADGRVVSTGSSAAWERSARIVAAGAGIGVRAQGAARPLPYALLVAGSGLDWREADGFVAVGAVAGADALLGGRLFAELRYERWRQRGPRHIEIPVDALAAAFGIRIG